VQASFILMKNRNIAPDFKSLSMKKKRSFDFILANFRLARLQS
jgi:hypothetical protein